MANEITDQMIDNIMVTALEGGINYWCGRANVVKKPSVETQYASHVISKGGELKLRDAESSDTWVLTREKLESGIAKAANHAGATVDAWYENHDCDSADDAVQFALFNKLVFG